MAFLLHGLKKDDLFVDVGANIGAYTILASTVVGAGCVAMEPIPDTYRRLVDNVNLNGAYQLVDCLNIGAGKEGGVLTFTADRDTLNHVLHTGERALETVDVPVKPLDEIIPSADQSTKIFIKIDVEGYTADVLAGASRTLADAAVVATIIEHSHMVEHYGSSIASIHAHMLGHDFIPCTYDPIVRKVIALEGVNPRGMDTIYVRDIQEMTDRIHCAPRFLVNKMMI